MTTEKLTEQDIDAMVVLIADSIADSGRLCAARAQCIQCRLADSLSHTIADLRRLREENERLEAACRDLAEVAIMRESVATQTAREVDFQRVSAALTAATERAERAEATVRELRAAYGVSETQQEADRDQFMASVESATAEQIAAWIEQRAEAIGTGRDELTGSEAARELALYGAVEQIRAGAWRKEQP